MASHPAFTFTVQDACEPEAKLIANSFVAVRIAGMSEGAEVFVATRAEAQAFIDAFTEAKNMLPGDDE